MQTEAEFKLFSWGLGAGVALLQDNDYEMKHHLFFWLHVGPFALEVTF